MSVVSDENNIVIRSVASATGQRSINFNMNETDQRICEFFPTSPDDICPLGPDASRLSSLKACSDWCKPDEPEVDPDLDEKLPQESAGSLFRQLPFTDKTPDDDDEWDLVGALGENEY